MKKNILLAFVSAFTVLACVGLAFILIRQERKLDELTHRLPTTPTTSDQQQPAIPEPVERVVTKSELWRPIQERVKDTVAQVFSQILEFNFLEPYKTPNQYSATGTAFFISDEGDLITNAHVVNQASTVWIQIPSLGKQIIDVDVLSVSPERDLALLRVKPECLKTIRAVLGTIPYLPFGDSDAIKRSEEVLALGYPLGQQSLKSTSGVISGREGQLIQMSAPINPGNSGGPLLNASGQVIGINTANVPDAQNVGYIIPINDLKNVLSDMRTMKLVRKPFLGVLFNNATESLTELLGNPEPGGCYVVEVVDKSTLSMAGVKRGDMLYEINHLPIDRYGEMQVPWTEDKISIVDYVARLSVGEQVHLVVYRNGERKELAAQFNQAELPAIRKFYPGYEEIDFEVAAGMVVMPLTLNHIAGLSKSVSGLAKFAELKHQTEPTLIVTHIFPNSQLYRSRSIAIGSTLNEINGRPVHTLQEFRAALQKPIAGKFLTIRATDNVARASDNVFVALPYPKVLAEETVLASTYHYHLSPTMQAMLDTHKSLSEIAPAVTKPGALNTVVT
ncbi:MAG: trypsin-like peptidase domain-containing protein [Epsilonproteobacteria bacterium]|nr:trypsin-like peptidase domain-containing protein [Campylobacterota bacterium]